MVINLENILSQEEFFKDLPLKNRTLSFLKPFLNDLETIGFTFDFSLVTPRKKYVAIDCDYFIKFIPEQEYLKEMLIWDYLKNKITKCLTPEAEEFVNNQLRKDLNSKKINSIKSNIKSNNYNSKIDHCIDYLNSFPKEKERIRTKIPKNNQKEQMLLLEREIKSLYKLNIKQMIEKSKEWTIKLNNRASKVEEDDAIEIVYEEGDYLVVKLIKESAFEREGKLMGHCVGSYYTPSNNSESFYSVRDKKNNPHATMRIGWSSRIEEVKGKNNGPIKKEYAYPLINFINESPNIKLSSAGYLDYLGHHCAKINILNKLFLIKGMKEDQYKAEISHNLIRNCSVNYLNKKLKKDKFPKYIIKEINKIIYNHYEEFQGHFVCKEAKQKYDLIMEIKNDYPLWDTFKKEKILKDFLRKQINNNYIYSSFINYFQENIEELFKNKKTKEELDKIFKTVNKICKVLDLDINRILSDKILLNIYFKTNNPLELKEMFLSKNHSFIPIFDFFDFFKFERKLYLIHSLYREKRSYNNILYLLSNITRNILQLDDSFSYLAQSIAKDIVKRNEFQLVPIDKAVRKHFPYNNEYTLAEHYHREWFNYIAKLNNSICNLKNHLHKYVPKNKKNCSGPELLAKEILNFIDNHEGYKPINLLAYTPKKIIEPIYDTLSEIYNNTISKH